MKKLFKVLIAVTMVCAMIPTAAFAETISEGNLGDVETEIYITEMMEAALEEYAANPQEIQMISVGNGAEYCCQVYELENGCQLIMEFEDGEEGANRFMESARTPLAMPRAANGETVWKDYGNRYFTAKATVTTSAGSGSISLENHYTLSENGIDERYGIAKGEGTTASGRKVIIDVIGTFITDSSARTLGASDVNMYAEYDVKSLFGGQTSLEKTVQLATTVGYVDHNYSTGQIKVKHSWALS